MELAHDALENQEDVMYELFPERDCPDEGFLDSFSMADHKKVGIWWGSFGSHGCAHQLKEVLIHEWLLCLRIVSSSIRIVWRLRAPGIKASACNFI